VRQIVPSRGIERRIAGRPKARAAWTVCWVCGGLALNFAFFEHPLLSPSGWVFALVSALSGALSLGFHFCERPRKMVIRKSFGHVIHFVGRRGASERRPDGDD
jgi:hypothetical protein